ncbi:hypothetical protein BS47DRAFT_196674 [Hydnum rufescens UP504]|uniref:Uncharacterized protein n=1 Tax=Hydnum rufescens UP504 TaxID=1448309 RepID=A0A9P6E116_9AGAM|nr:hypothetical protein BS47DRAFT_196674 [Hydnum rufescens UP504]
MAPFSLSLRSKRSRGARPRTPSSPASFATPRSPPWFVAPSWPQQRLFMDINTPQGEKTLILPHEENSAAATSPPQPAEQEKIQAIAVPRPSTTTGVRRPSLSSVAPPSPTHRRAESQGLSSNVHASVRRGPPRPLQIRSTPDLSISPNRKASRFKGEAGRFDTKELPPVPDRKGQSNFPEGPSVAEPRDTSQPDKPVLPDRSNSTIARQISGNREKKSSQKPRSEVPGGCFSVDLTAISGTNDPPPRPQLFPPFHVRMVLRS